MFRDIKSVANLVGLFGLLCSESSLGLNKIVTLGDDFIEDTTLRAGYTYLVQGEIHVPTGITVTIEDGVQIFIKNGKIKGKNLTRSALIFDQGSKLQAKRFEVKAADAHGRPEKKADNGGIWFLGAWQDASKDHISVVVKASSSASRFVAQQISVSDLGTLDPSPTPRRLNPRGDDIDGISVLGVGPSEWKIEKMRSEYSGDDGFDVTNSQIELRELFVFSPFEDGLNLSSSRVRVTRKLEVEMTGNTTIQDRDIFDLEVDDGPSYVTLAQGCRVDIHGVFGDEIKLRTSDLMKPQAGSSEKYSFHGILRKGPTTLYSRTED